MTQDSGLATNILLLGLQGEARGHLKLGLEGNSRIWFRGTHLVVGVKNGDRG